ncbi:unnamed protein product [Hydatigera taeniaeformis]|uniref:Skp1_POZ domain-containing protein n=1 Tax=Hydatigena taeniaeformis TaxID=6205 RepID=A0A0R3WWD1_HYDTA|nr:unnamed protein product [Hydatigera taeniaeformis]
MATTQKNESPQETVFGGAEGPDAMYVKLVSSDDHEFYVKREYALTSGIIKAMLSGPGMFVSSMIVVVFLLSAFCSWFEKQNHCLLVQHLGFESKLL